MEDERTPRASAFSLARCEGLAEWGDDGAGDVECGNGLDRARLDLGTAVGAQNQRQVAGFGGLGLDQLRQRGIERIAGVRYD